MQQPACSPQSSWQGSRSAKDSGQVFCLGKVAINDSMFSYAWKPKTKDERNGLYWKVSSRVRRCTEESGGHPRGPFSSLNISVSNVFHVPAPHILAAEFPSLSSKLQTDRTSCQNADKSIKDAEAVVLGHERRPELNMRTKKRGNIFTPCCGLNLLAL